MNGRRREGVKLLSNNCPTWEYFVLGQIKGNLGLCYQEEMNRLSTIWWHGRIYTSDKCQAGAGFLTSMVLPKEEVDAVSEHFQQGWDGFFTRRAPHSSDWTWNHQLHFSASGLHFCSCTPTPTIWVMERSFFSPPNAQSVDLSRKLNFLVSQSTA